MTENMNPHKIVVLDDDPTGTQTVHGIDVYTDWSMESLRQGFRERRSIFFILTNSRSFSLEKTMAVHREIGARLQQVSAETGIPFLIISRGDSTLRGHYPAETESLKAGMKLDFDGEILVPCFPEGGRITVDNIHYVRQNGEYLPVADTEFARDRTFGFRHSHLGEWVEEKTDGQYTADRCHYIPAGIESNEIFNRLLAVTNFNKVIVNAATYEDLSVFSGALWQAVQSGKTFLFRTAAAFPKVMGQISDRALLTPAEMCDPNNPHGGLVMIGSHVQRSTSQFNSLRAANLPLKFIEFNVRRYFSGESTDEPARILPAIEAALKDGRTAVVYTTRDFVDTGSREGQLEASVRISASFAGMVSQLKSTPRYLITKGGITSSDVITIGLGIRRAEVTGQAAPGIPVWKAGSESLFPGMSVIIFPGNVGDKETLRQLVESLEVR